MKFVKHAAVLVAASALVLTAGVGAAYATTDAVVSNESVAAEVTPAAAWDGFTVDDFGIRPSVDSFTMTVKYSQLVQRSESEIQLVINGADGGVLFASSVSVAGGIAAVGQYPEIDQAVAEMNKEFRSRNLVFKGIVEKTVAFKATGPYSVSLYEVSKSGSPLLAVTKVEATPAVPEMPAFDRATSVLTIPASVEFTYEDDHGVPWAAGKHTLTEPVNLIPKANSGFVIAEGSYTPWGAFTPEVKPEPEKKPETEKGTDKDKSPGTDKDKNIDEKPTTGGGLPPASAPNENQLSPALEGKVGAQPTAVAGAQVKIFVGTQFAGKEVEVYVFSEPTYLGRHKVDSDGNVTVTLPAGLTGSHRLAVYDGGELIGWNRIIISDSTDGAAGTGFVAGTVTTSRLATTGSEATGTLALLAAGSVVLGAAGLVARRRARLSVA